MPEDILSTGYFLFYNLARKSLNVKSTICYANCITYVAE